MLDGIDNTPITLPDAVRLLRESGSVVHVHPTTVRRWITRGVCGTRLEAVRAGGRWLTSQAALQRFLKAIRTNPNP